jgi:hypothetical protein
MSTNKPTRPFLAVQPIWLPSAAGCRPRRAPEPDRVNGDGARIVLICNIAPGRSGIRLARRIVRVIGRRILRLNWARAGRGPGPGTVAAVARITSRGRLCRAGLASAVLAGDLRPSLPGRPRGPGNRHRAPGHQGTRRPAGKTSPQTRGTAGKAGKKAKRTGKRQSKWSHMIRGAPALPEPSGVRVPCGAGRGVRCWAHVMDRARARPSVSPLRRGRAGDAPGLA